MQVFQIRAYVGADAPRRRGIDTVHGVDVVERVRSASVVEGKNPGDWWWTDTVKTVGLG
jgi:hypothetical protein